MIDRVQNGVVVIMVIFAGVLGLLVHPIGAGGARDVAVLLVFTMPVVRSAVDDPRTGIIVTSILAAVSVNLYLERGIYPTLSTYDGEAVASAWVNEHYPGATVVVPREGQVASFAFGLGKEPVYVDRLADTATVTTRPYLILINGDARQPPDPRTIRSFDHFHVSRPTIGFLNQRTRRESLRRLDLVLVGANAARPVGIR